MLKKGDNLELEIIDCGMDFEGIAKVDNFTVFVLGAIVGEKVLATVIKVTKTYAIAKVDEYILKSKYRRESVCEVSNRCGGCQAHHIEYNFGLEIKRNNILSLFRKQVLDSVVVQNVIGMGLTYYYRNKAQYPVRKICKVNKIGFYSKKSHSIIENKGCFIQNRVIDMLAKIIFDKLISLGFSMYSDEEKWGDIKHIIIKRGYHTSQIMVVIVVSRKELMQDLRFAKLIEDIGKERITSFFLNLNSEDTNKILGVQSALIYGEKYITDKIGDCTFYISPKSFFQVNTVQVEVLYNLLKEKLELNKEDVLFDLYSGVGTIGIFLSKYVKEVYGIEIEEEAVLMANMNISLNEVTNCEYIAGSAEEKIEEFKMRNINPDIIVVDPPRKGLDEKCIENILELKPKKIGYVSCNPATLARDLKLLSDKYDIGVVTPVDMFPYTSNVECVVVLHQKKENV
ncbi:MAG: 23S rRNA (uracil(1939)-C(5))-methyltransferase RlmD [Clostridia bacterium]|nr:23S rRNA (uracil(1939)-C(5))-methyltransferase RlmD [Clostridia bacterium]